MASTEEATRYKENWQAEIDNAELYLALAQAESRARLARIYRELAQEEEQHAKVWEEKLRAAGFELPSRRLGWRTRVVGWLARRFGTRRLLTIVAEMEEMDGRRYDLQIAAREAGLPAEERSHARRLRDLSTSADDTAGEEIAEFEGPRTIKGNALRAAVLGATDGLVANLSLVMGVAGAQMSNQAILITGIAGLLAGASSMALGEWLSVQSSRELNDRHVKIEARKLAESPAAEERKLSLIYQSKGVPEAGANEIAAHIMLNKDSALETLVREELGVDPKELGGSAWEASIMSFMLFAAGAIMPVLPFLFLIGWEAITASLIVSALALFVTGAAITRMTGRSVLFSGSRQVVFGLTAAALTFGIGRLIGVTLMG